MITCFCTSLFILLLLWISCEANHLVILEVVFETWIFLVCFYYFWKYRFLLILNVYICEYLHQILPWKEINEAFPGKIQTKKLFFYLNKIQAAQIRNMMQYSSISIKKRNVYTDQWLWKYQFLHRKIQARCKHKIVVCSTYSCAIWSIVRSQENVAFSL